MKNKKMKNSKIRYLFFGITATATVVALNILFSNVFFRADLTSDKRYTLAKSTYKFLQNMDDSAHFEVLMDGDMPMEYGKIKRDVEDMLREFEAYSNGRITFSQINPIKDIPKKDIAEKINDLAQNGVRPLPISTETETGKTEQYIFTAAFAYSGKRKTVVNFIKNSIASNRMLSVHIASQEIEYELTNALRKLTKKNAEHIGFWQTNKTLEEYYLAEFKKSLTEYYSFDNIYVTDSFQDLSKYKAIVIAKPEEKFTEAQKFIIDQYIMNGGRVLWAIDLMTVATDTLMKQSSTMAFAQDLNINDILFKYGVRINYNLVLDYKCGKIPINIAPAAFKADFKLMDWYFCPTPIPAYSHPISKNLNFIKSEYISALDTVGGRGEIKKTILLHSSPYSRIAVSPVIIDLRMVEQPFDERFFNKKFIPLGLLLEGTFTSVFQHRIMPPVKNRPDLIKTKTSKGKMIVLGDGDILKNDIQQKGSKIFTFELGYDSKTGQTFSNKDFLLNAINYLCDENELIELRAREFKPRFLNKERVKKYKQSIIFNNVIFPIILLIIIGVLLQFVRRYLNIKKK